MQRLRFCHSLHRICAWLWTFLAFYSALSVSFYKEIKCALTQYCRKVGGLTWSRTKVIMTVIPTVICLCITHGDTVPLLGCWGPGPHFHMGPFCHLFPSTSFPSIVPFPGPAPGIGDIGSRLGRQILGGANFREKKYFSRQKCITE